MTDDSLVTRFERPYREGNYIPPHIWGDAAAEEESGRAAERAAALLILRLTEGFGHRLEVCCGWEGGRRGEGAVLTVWRQGMGPV